MRYFLNLEGITKRISDGYRYPYKKSTVLCIKFTFQKIDIFRLKKSIHANSGKSFKEQII